MTSGLKYPQLTVFPLSPILFCVIHYRFWFTDNPSENSNGRETMKDLSLMRVFVFAKNRKLYLNYGFF